MNATSYLTPQQVEVLLRPINANRVSRDGKGFSHLEAYDVKAHLTRVFGFARWDEETRANDLVFETSEQKKGQRGEYTAWTVCYRTVKRLTIKAPDGTPLASYDGEACGDATNQPSRADAHDLALKTSASQALKRAATDLADQFGLSLYSNGSTAPLVRNTLVRPTVGASAAGDEDQAPVPDAHLTSPLAPERVEETQREATAPPPVATPAAAGPSQVEGEGPALSPHADAIYKLAVAARLQSPEDRSQVIGSELLPRCVKQHVRQEIVPEDSGMTLHAFLINELQDAARSKQQQMAGAR